MKKDISFLIIVPTFNSYNDLKRLFVSIKSQTFQHWRVLFIDGNSMIEIYNANTISYSSNQAHGDYAARIGIYRDSYKNSHEVQFDNWEIKTKN